MQDLRNGVFRLFSGKTTQGDTPATGALPPHPQDLTLCCLPDEGVLQNEKRDATCIPLDPRSVEASESALGLLPSITLSSAQFPLIITVARPSRLQDSGALPPACENESHHRRLCSAKNK